MSEKKKENKINDNNKNESKRKYNFNIRQSLRLRLALTMIVAVATIIVLCWGINLIFLQTIYEKTKVNAVEDAYKFINSKFTSQVMESYHNNDISSLDMDKMFTEVERASSAGSLIVTVYKKYNMGDENYYEIYYPTNNSDRERENFGRKIKAIDNLENNDNVKIIKKTDDYIIYKNFDSRLRFRNIELVGLLDAGVSINLNTNVALIEESAKISNRFLAIIGIIVGILASVILYFISNNISKPVLQLADIAKKMANLEFDVKYKVGSNDEIGVLGNSINSLSTKLEKTITELKNANNELKNDIKKKEEIDEMRREFLSNVSHELKTPIAIIQGYAEGLVENVNDDEQSRKFYCDVIVDEASKMNNMVKKLLDLNNIEFGDSPLDIVRFNVVELINGVISSTKILFQQKEIDIEFNGKGKIYVWADEYFIEEVLINYISNALNHVDENKKIKVSIEKKSNVVRINVFNSGNSIPDEDIERIWDKFYKVDKARTREYGGSGVGLSIVKAIMNKHGREYGVENVDNGVNFWIELDSKID